MVKDATKKILKGGKYIKRTTRNPSASQLHLKSSPALGKIDLPTILLNNITTYIY
jgi:hypothetical protein